MKVFHQAAVLPVNYPFYRQYWMILIDSILQGILFVLSSSTKRGNYARDTLFPKTK